MVIQVRPILSDSLVLLGQWLDRLGRFQLVGQLLGRMGDDITDVPAVHGSVLGGPQAEPSGSTVIVQAEC